MPGLPSYDPITFSQQDLCRVFQQAAIRPNSIQAVRLFDQFVSWRMPDRKTNESDYFLGNIDRTMRWLGAALSSSILPAMAVEELTLDRFEALSTQFEQLKTFSTIAGVPYFCVASDSFLVRVTSIIRRSLAGRSHEEVRGAADAISVWVELHKDKKITSLPRTLIEHLVTTVLSRREPGLICLLDCARKLLQHQLFTEMDISRLWEALEELLSDSQYDRVGYSDERAISISLVRTECVRLAKALDSICASRNKVATDWFEAAAVDPLPEVRFALSS